MKKLKCCDDMDFKFRMRDDHHTFSPGCDVRLYKNDDSYSICGIICEEDLHILKTWGNKSDSLSRLGLDTHYINNFHRIKIVGVDEI
jgi:hypothetical protein